MKTFDDYVTTRETLYDMLDELKQRRRKATAKVVEKVLDQWVQIEKDIDLKNRLLKN